MIALSLQSVTKRYGDLVAVDHLSLDVPAGTITGLLGPNGAGKTTTIRMILNIVAPDEGRITLFGQPLDERTKDRIGFLPEERGLYPKMKVGELLRFFSGIKGTAGPAAETHIDAWLERMGLSEWKGKRLDALSKGMQQKVQFIATVAHDPDLIVLDEPVTGLDPVNTDVLKDILFDLKSRGKTILLSTHLMDHAERLCDAICLINRGRNVLSGSLSDVKQAHSDLAVRRYVVVEPSLNDIFLKVVKESGRG
jgi:ABC-2 type transport system ATP-binding protein